MSEENSLTPQRKIGSGFGRDSTAAEVIAVVDLTGKTAIVTGGYSGLGLETVRALASAGAAVVVPARRPEHARDVLAAAGLTPATERGDVSVAELDLADQASVKEFAAGFLAGAAPGTSRSLDILINNAAIMASPERRVGPGWESQFATNHLGHFALTNLLWPALAAAQGARVVSLSSTGHKLSGIRFDDINFDSGYDKWRAYGQAKTANALFAVQLDALGRDFGVRAFAVHPGGIMTELQRHLPREEMIAAGWMARPALQDTGTGRRYLGLGRDGPDARGNGRRLLRGLRHRRSHGAGIARSEDPGRGCPCGGQGGCRSAVADVGRNDRDQRFPLIGTRRPRTALTARGGYAGEPGS